MKNIRTAFIALAALSLFVQDVAAQTANGRATTVAPTYLNNSAAPLSLDVGGNLRTTSAGTSSNGADDVATSSDNAKSVVWNFVFNGTTWDRLRGDTTFGAWVNIKNASLAVTGPLTDTQLRATPVPVSGPLTDTQLRATPVPVSGTVTATGPLTDTQLRATPVPVSGPLTDAQLRAAVVPTQDNSNGAVAAAVPARAIYNGVNSSGNLVGLLQASASVAISGNTATTAQLVALSGTTKIYVTSFDFLSAGTANVTLVYGTGTNCGTGTTALTGAYNLLTQSGVAKGSGLGPVLVVPAGNALCWTNSAAVQVSGSLSYTQF